MPRARAIFKGLAIGLGGVVALGAAAVAGGYAWINSDGGRAWLMAQIEEAASTPGEMELSIGALEGNLPQSLAARDIVLRDGEGPWLTVAALEVDWHPWSLLDRTLDIGNVKLTGVDLARLPSAPAETATQEDTGSGSLDLLNFPLTVRFNRLAADEIALGEPVLGQAARFTLSGEAGRSEDGSLTTRLDLVRLDGIEGRLLARLHYVPQSDSLTADVTAASAAGGLLAAALDMPDLPGAQLKIAGSGPLADWNGDFTLHLGDIAEARADIGLRREANDDLGFRVTGTGTIRPPEESDLWRLAAGLTEIDLAGTWQQAGRLRLERLSASNDNLRLSLQGDVVPASGELDMTLSAAADDASALATLAGLDSLGPVAADIAVRGTMNRPQADLELSIESVATPDVAADKVALAGKANAESDLLGNAPVLALDLAGRLDAPRLPGEDAVNAVLGDSLPVSLTGRLDLARLVLDIERLEASTGSARLTAGGSFNLNDGNAQFDANAEVSELASLQPLTDIRLGGRLGLAGPVTLDNFGSRIAADLKGRWEQPSSDIGLIAAVAGTGLDVTTRLAIDGGAVRVEQMTALSPVTDLKASLTVAGNELRGGRYSLALADAAVLAGELGVATSGPATVEGTIAGPFDALDLSGQARLARLSVEEQTLSAIDAGYRLRISGAAVDGPVEVSLASPYGPAKASADLRVRADAVTLSALRGTLPQTTVTGSLAVPLDGRPIAADLKGDFADLSPWLQVAGVSGGGTGSARLQWNQPGTAAPVVVSAELSRLRVQPDAGAEPLRAERVTLTLNAQDPALAEPGKIDIAAETLRWDNLDLKRLDLAARGNLAALDVTLKADGRWVEPLTLTAAGRVAQQGDSLSVALDKAEGEIFGQPLLLRETATLTVAGDITRLENLALASGDTMLNADASIGEGRVAVTAALDALPLTTVDAFWDSGLDGSVSAEIDLQGSFAAPRGTARLTASGLRPRDAKDSPPLTLEASADWRDGRVAATGELGGAKVASARFTADAPLEMTPQGSVAVPPQGPLAASLDWTGDIATLLLFVPLPEHRLNGDASIAVTVDGTVAAPQAEGRIALQNGRYENLETGTVLRDLTLAAEANEERVTLSTLSANDGAGGTLRGEGSLTVDPAARFPLDVAVTFDKFHAVRRDDVTAVTGGKVTLNGDIDAPKVQGRFTTETVEISLLTSLPPNVVSLDVIEVNNGEVAAEPEEAKAPPPVDPILDIVIDMPRRVFVRGRGLDSEWAGRLSVQGPASSPAVSGELNLVRGFLSVVGKPFNLTDGKVNLPEGADSEPSLDVTAVHEGKDLTVTARLSGTLSQPSLDLTSSPEVPRDEIISRVLFNKSAAQLTAAEAAQLAIALRELTGAGGGADILGFARQTLGVDVLRIETADTGDPAVEAGKYLTDEVYLGVKQGADPQSTAAGVEVELTPNITVESEVTGSGASKSGVRFQWDY